MNIAKKNTLLIVLLVVQAALIAFLYRPGRNVAPVAASLFKDLAPGQVTSLTITDDQAKAITLSKKEGWRVDPGDYPADQAKVDTLINKLAAIKSSRLVSQTKGSHARLKVAEADFNRKVELARGDQKSVFYLGTSPSSKSIHLRLAEAKEVYLANDLAASEVQADRESWWQTRYLNQPLDALTGLTIVNASGTIELVGVAAKDTKGAKQGWQLKGSPETPLDAKRVETLVNSLSEITIASYLDQGASPKGKPLATVTYQTKEGGTTLQIWAKAKSGDGDQVVKASNSPLYAKIKEYAVKEALEAKLDGLKIKTKPASETPGAAGTLPPVVAPPAPAGEPPTPLATPPAAGQ